ncbi:hypothetical protein [Nocardia thraciensis]
MYDPSGHDAVEGPQQHSNPCHIHVRFENPLVELDYQDERGIAVRFAAAAAQFGAAVTIDAATGRNFPPLPCRSLWA